MHWIVQGNAFSEEGWDALVEALTRQKCRGKDLEETRRLINEQIAKEKFLGSFRFCPCYAMQRGFVHIIFKGEVECAS